MDVIVEVYDGAGKIERRIKNVREVVFKVVISSLRWRGHTVSLGEG